MSLLHNRPIANMIDDDDTDDSEDCDDGYHRIGIPGVATGMAWTAAGGELLYVEAEILPGTKREDLVLTGQLGSVMYESALLAVNWVRVNFHRYELSPIVGRNLFENSVHIHFPAGAVRKDGPSAGVTIVAALVSLCSGVSVLPDLAMTGEITLRGVVLKVGGIKSKVLAAHKAGIKQIILPKNNEVDLKKVSSRIKKDIKFHYVSTVDDVIRVAFGGKISEPKPDDPTQGLTSKL